MKREVNTEAAAEQEALAAQLGESDTFLDKMKRMAANNKLAVFSAILILLFLILAVLAPVITPYSFDEQDLLARLAAPSAKHLLGTDELGRDVFTRLLYGARVSMAVGIIPTVVSMLIGVMLGMVSGYYGITDEDGTYAELALGVLGENGTMGVRAVLLVKFADDEKDSQETNGRTGGADNEKDSEEIEESELESETASEAETETELSMETSLELTSGIALYASPAQISDAYTATGQELAGSAKQSIPSIGSINGEWQILGLARSGQEVDASVYSQYKANVIQAVKECKGVLHEKKYTEYSRVVLALTALGEDVTNVGGYNLLEPLSDFDQTVWQGVNGAMFALIAFDSHKYEIPTAAAGKTQTTRQKLIQYI